MCIGAIEVQSADHFLPSRWGEEVAIKLIKKGSIENSARSMKVQREIEVLKVSSSLVSIIFHVLKSAHCFCRWFGIHTSSDCTKWSRLIALSASSSSMQAAASYSNTSWHTSISGKRWHASFSPNSSLELRTCTRRRLFIVILSWKTCSWTETRIS